MSTVKRSSQANPGELSSRITKKNYLGNTFKGTALPKKVVLYYWSDLNENLWTNVKSKSNWGYCRVLFRVFFIENKLFTENGIKRRPR